MDFDKINLIVNNIESLISMLKEEIKLNPYESQISDYDEIFSEDE